MKLSFLSVLGMLATLGLIVGVGIYAEKRHAANRILPLYSSGLVTLPFFINHRGQSNIRQGITTEVTGNCGFTVEPITPDHKEALVYYPANTIVLTRPGGFFILSIYRQYNTAGFMGRDGGKL